MRKPPNQRDFPNNPVPQQPMTAAQYFASLRRVNDTFDELREEYRELLEIARHLAETLHDTEQVAVLDARLAKLAELERPALAESDLGVIAEVR